MSCIFRIFCSVPSTSSVRRLSPQGIHWVPRNTWPCNRIVIPTGAQRSGGTCCFFPRYSPPSLAPEVLLAYHGCPASSASSAPSPQRHQYGGSPRKPYTGSREILGPATELSSRPERSVVEGPAVSFPGTHHPL